MAHDEPPHLDLRCLQIQLFSSRVLKEFKRKKMKLVKFENSVDPYEQPYLDLQMRGIKSVFICQSVK